MNAIDKSIEQHHLDNALAQLDSASQDFIEGLHHELVQLREQEEETERMIRVLSLRCESYKNEVERLKAKGEHQ